MTVIAFVGSRSFNDYSAMHNKFRALIDIYGHDFKIVSGGANGADKIAEHEARINNIECVVIKPDFSNGYDVRQYHYRNDRIIQLADRVIAFWDGKSRGTKSVIEKCKSINKIIEVIQF